MVKFLLRPNQRHKNKKTDYQRSDKKWRDEDE